MNQNQLAWTAYLGFNEATLRWREAKTAINPTIREGTNDKERDLLNLSNWRVNTIR